MSAFLGGVLAQEIVKSTGKFTPIPGFLHFSAPEALPTEKVDVEDSLPRGTYQGFFLVLVTSCKFYCFKNR
jgi:hypothetical protein